MTKLYSADTTETISGPVSNNIETRAADEQILSSSELPKNREGWDKLIDHRLIEWGSNPSQLEDDGIEVPSRESIKIACQLAYVMRNNESPFPTRIVPNGEGGIVFERMKGQTFITIEIDENGSLEITEFIDSRLVCRQRFL